MKDFDVCGLGNAIVDIFVEVSDDEFAPLGFERGTMRLVDWTEQRGLLDRLHARDPRLVSGGSVANSIIALSQLGGRGAFIGCVGDDRYGLHYAEEFSQLGIDIQPGHRRPDHRDALPHHAGRRTDDAHAWRCPATCRLGVDAERIKASEWLFVEGYVFANPETGQGAIREAIQVARKNGVKVAITCSDAFVVDVFADAFFPALAETDLLFCNAAEACAVTRTHSSAEAFDKLKGKVGSVVVTDGPHGAFVRHAGTEAHVAAFPCQPRDLTGAGDMFAGGFLYGITHGISPAKSARAANFLAMKVITQIGARLHHGTRTFWDQALAAT